MNEQTPNSATPKPAPRHDIYIPGFAAAKIGLAIFGLVLIFLSLDKFAPLAKLAFTGGRAQAEAVRIIRTDSTGQETILRTDAEVLSATKAGEETRDRESVYWVEFRFDANGKTVEARSPLGQHIRPLQPLRDSDGLPSTASIWFDPQNPQRIAIPFLFGTWFMPGMLVLFGTLGTFMGLTLWWFAKKPIEMPDLSQSHGEADSK